MSSTTTANTTTTSQIPNWNMKADYVETCNCDYGCPCNFSGFPTYGNCRALLLFHIRSGSYGNTKLMVSILSLHNHGQRLSMKVMALLLLLITNKANEEQRRQLYRLFLDRQRGIVLHYLQVRLAFLEPQFVDIHAKIDGRKSSFSVPGLVNVEVESFKNPVTGEEQDTKIQLPKGLVWKLADAAKTKIMRITSPDLNFDHSGKNAFYSVVEFKGP